jgi:hypothetical protein
VCSTPETAPETALQDLTCAIDELAADSGSGAAAGHLAERIARLWGMIADLDPELARRRSGYEGKPDRQAGWPPAPALHIDGPAAT